MAAIPDRDTPSVALPAECGLSGDKLDTLRPVASARERRRGTGAGGARGAPTIEGWECNATFNSGCRPRAWRAGGLGTGHDRGDAAGDRGGGHRLPRPPRATARPISPARARATPAPRCPRATAMRPRWSPRRRRPRSRSWRTRPRSRSWRRMPRRRRSRLARTTGRRRGRSAVAITARSRPWPRRGSGRCLASCAARATATSGLSGTRGSANLHLGRPRRGGRRAGLRRHDRNARQRRLGGRAHRARRDHRGQAKAEAGILKHGMRSAGIACRPHRRLCQQLRHLQLRSRGRGSGMDAAGDRPARLALDEAKASVQDVRRERFDFLGSRSVRMAMARMATGCRVEPIEEEHPPVQGKVNDLLVPGNIGASPEFTTAEPPGWRLGRVFQPRHAPHGLSGVDNHVYDRSHFLFQRHKVRSRGTSAIPMGSCSADSAYFGYTMSTFAPDRVPRDEASQKAGCGNPHVRFDERGRKRGDCQLGPSHRARPRLLQDITSYPIMLFIR